MATLEEIYARAVRDPVTGCLIWQGSISGPQGQPTVRHENKTYYVSRAVYELHHEVWLGPDEKVRHKCDTPLCIEIEHLILGTQQDNVQDMIDRGRLAQGEGHPSSLLNDDKVRDIRRRYAAGGCSYSSLGTEYGVSNECIRGVVVRKTWAHVK
jgi:hypothetical protein